MQDGQELQQKISELEEQEQKAKIERQKVINKALKTDNVDLVYKAQNYLQKQYDKYKSSDNKSLLIDPQSLNSAMGYREKPFRLSYQLLRNMSHLHIVRAIIETRVEQMLSFAQPQTDRYDLGFKIVPKDFNVHTDKIDELDDSQRREIDEISEFVMNCGEDANKWHGDDMNSFMRKIVVDSLSMDQACFEIVGNRGGGISEFFAVDGATMRLSDTFQVDPDSYNGDKEVIDGYLPYYSQVYQGHIVAEFYPWEMGFGMRNPQSNIYSNGYGRSELEDLITTITNILNADAYNANYFKIGSNPKGILRVTGNVNESRLEEFKQHWQSQMAGVENAHRLPVIEAEKMDWVNTQQSNKDMEYGKYQEFLIKLLCSIYKIDPAEIGFPMSGSHDSKPLFEGSNEARLKYSKDKGLKPLAMFIQRLYNRYIIPRKNKNYQMIFAGLEATDAEKELEANIKRVQHFETLNEVRRKYGLDDIEGGDIVLNPVFMQSQQMQMMGGMESNEFVDEEEGTENIEEADNPFSKSVQQSFEELFTASS